MAHQIITNQVNVMDLSRIIDKKEYIVDLIAEVGLPLIVVTNKKMYKMLLGQGIVVETGEPHNAHNQVVEAFDFSVDHPIFKSTYQIVKQSEKAELKILTYSIMEKLYSILKIRNYLQENWDEMHQAFLANRKDYDELRKILPQIPLLKEYFDAFCAETKDAISFILTLFKIYCMHCDILDDAVNVDKCIKFIEEHSLSNQRDVFYSLQQINIQFRALRNAMTHPENYKVNMFRIWNVFLNADDQLSPPLCEYKSKDGEGTIYVLEYIHHIYESLLSISNEFLNTLV